MLTLEELVKTLSHSRITSKPWKKAQVLLYNVQRFQRERCVLEDSLVRLLVLLITAVLRWRWYVWSIGGMILTGENWSTGRETLYSVGGRWMNGCGALVEWYWQGKTEVLGEKHYTAWVVGEWMGMEHWWNDTDWWKLKYWERSLLRWHFVYHRSYKDWLGIELWSPLWEFCDLKTAIKLNCI